MSYTWPVVISALAGVATGAFSGYQFAHWLVDKAHTYIVIGVVIICVPFTIYFSIDKVPLFTQAVYFIPFFGIVYVWIGSVVIEQAASQDDALFNRDSKKDRQEADRIKRKMELDDLIAEQERRKRAREHQAPVSSMSDMELDERIRKLKNRYR